MIRITLDELKIARPEAVERLARSLGVDLSDLTLRRGRRAAVIARTVKALQRDAQISAPPPAPPTSRGTP